MSSGSYLVSPRSWAEIDQIALRIRSLLYADSGGFLPIMTFVERVLDNTLNLLRLEVVSVEEMGDMEACIPIEGARIPRMLVREDVYEGACDNNPRCRFTIAHEIGHLCLHTGNTVMPRRPASGEVIPPYRDSEVQANQFAAAILMPVGAVFEGDSIADIAGRFGVSREAAHHRLDYLQKKGLLSRRTD